MCRLALLDKEGIRFVEKEYGLLNILDYLQNALGGNGNGYCIITNDNKHIIKKGVDLTNQEIVDDVMDNIDNLKYFIYHTRLASCGDVSDINCHPFTKQFKQYEQVLCMNGTEYKVKYNDEKYYNTTLTDTEVILDKYYYNLIGNLLQYHSNFIGVDKNNVFAINNNGTLLQVNNNKIVFFISSLPYELYWNKNFEINIAPKIWCN